MALWQQKEIHLLAAYSVNTAQFTVRPHQVCSIAYGFWWSKLGTGSPPVYFNCKHILSSISLLQETCKPKHFCLFSSQSRNMWMLVFDIYILPQKIIGCEQHCEREHFKTKQEKIMSEICLTTASFDSFPYQKWSLIWGCGWAVPMIKSFFAENT